MKPFPLLVLTALLAAPAAAQTLTLRQAVDTALADNNELKSARESVKSSGYTLRSSYGNFLPHIAAEAAGTRLDSPIELDLNPVRSAIIAANAATLGAAGGTPAQSAALAGALNSALPDFNMQVQKQTYYQLALTAYQPLYAGGRIRAASKAKKEALAGAEKNYDALRDKVVAGVITGYFRLLLLDRVTEIRRQTLEGMREHDETARKLYEQGMISNVNRLRAGVALAEADRELKKAARDRELAAILLSNLTGADISSATLVTGFIPAEPPSSPDEFTAKAAASNPSLSLLSHSRGQLEAKYSVAKAGMRPTVTAFGKYELYKADLTVLDPEWAAGISVKLPLFSGFSDYEDIRAARADLAAIDQLTANARKLVRTEVLKDHHDMAAAAEQYESLDKSLDLTAENLRLNKLSFAQGVATSLEVVDAQLALDRVKTERYSALYNYACALTELLRACGDELNILNYPEKAI